MAKFHPIWSHWSLWSLEVSFLGFGKVHLKWKIQVTSAFLQKKTFWRISNSKENEETEERGTFFVFYVFGKKEREKKTILRGPSLPAKQNCRLHWKKNYFIVASHCCLNCAVHYIEIWAWLSKNALSFERRNKMAE